MNLFISISVLVIISGLLACLFYLRNRQKRDIVVTVRNFGEGRPSLTREQRNRVIDLKIRQQGIAFKACLFSMIISFGLGAFAIWKFIDHGTDRTFLIDALSISGGVAATISFKRLYDKCTHDLNNLKDF